MAHPLGQLAIVAGVIACIGCSHSPAAPDSGSGSTKASGVYTTPPIRGLVRETNGGPIAGAAVRLVAFVSGPTLRSPAVVSDDAGMFVVPPSTDLCQSARTVGFEISKPGYWFQGRAAIPCTAVSNPQEVSLEVKGQRAYTVASGAAVEITLSNDDLDWLTDENGYSCGPCKIVGVTLPARERVTIHAERSGPVPIYLWVEGDRGYGDLVRLQAVPFSPDDTAVDVNILPEWRNLDLMLKIGLPYGGRFPASSVIPVRIEMR